MVFKSKAAERYHRGPPWATRFVEALYPLCIGEPTFTELRQGGEG
jgi:hypothetical protein